MSDKLLEIDYRCALHAFIVMLEYEQILADMKNVRQAQKRSGK